MVNLRMSLEQNLNLHFVVVGFNLVTILLTHAIVSDTFLVQSACLV